MIRYLEVLTSFYEDVLEGLKKTDDSVRKTICESHLNEFAALGKFRLM